MYWLARCCKRGCLMGSTCLMVMVTSSRRRQIEFTMRCLLIIRDFTSSVKGHNIDMTVVPLDVRAILAIMKLSLPLGGGVEQEPRMNDDHRKKVLNRLKSIEGHVRGIERMVEEDTYCIDVVRQTIAVQRALDKVNALIMQNHLNE